MPNNIQKSLQGYLSKIKTPRSQFRIATKKLINLKGCRHPRTPSFSLDDNKNKKTTNTNNNNNNNDEATLADIDRFLFENFKSLYLEDKEETNNNNHTKRVVSKDEETDEEKVPKPSPMFGSSNTLKEPPSFDFYGSKRFFVTHGFSGSMVETSTTTKTNTFDEVGSSSNSPTTNTNSSPKGGNGMDQTLPDNCVVLLGSSANPYEDFRRSMEGVMEARLRNNQMVDWNFMQELFFCFINLNEKKSYKFILSAFVDLTSMMRQGF